MADALDQKGLKPCPFCGGKAERAREWGGRLSLLIHCSEANCLGHHCEQDEMGGYNHEPGSLDEAIAAWNRRSTVIPAEIAGVARELRELAERRAVNEGPFTPQNLAEWRAATLIERLAASQAETRRQALEEAVKVALRKPDSFGDAIPKDDRFRDGWIQASMRIASAIRALIDQPGTEGGLT